LSIQVVLKAGSSLQGSIRNGKQALRSVDRARVEAANGRILDSLDLETALSPGAPSIKRWDYLLGTSLEEQQVCGLEVHPANTGEARVVVAKKKDTEKALQPHMVAGCSIKRWYWVASGTTKITRNTPEARLLDLAGITLAGSHLVLRSERPPER